MDVHSLDCRGMIRSSCIFVVYTRMGSRTARGPCRIGSIVPADASFPTPSFWLLALVFISIQSRPFINFLELSFLCHCLSTSFIGRHLRHPHPLVLYVLLEGLHLLCPENCKQESHSMGESLKITDYVKHLVDPIFSISLLERKQYWNHKFTSK